MVALTLKHPWPFAICYLGKRIENRTWKPPQRLIGKFFAIHGGRRPQTRDGLGEVADIARGLLDRNRDHPDFLAYLAAHDDDCKLGDATMPGIVAVARLTGFVETTDDPWFCGPLGWTLDDVFVLPRPLLVGGAQGLWTIPDETLGDIRSQWREVRVSHA
jgi:hypothetical protein